MSKSSASVLRMLTRPKGASNAEFVSKLGYRWTRPQMSALCKKHGYRLSVEKVDGDKLRYRAA